MKDKTLESEKYREAEEKAKKMKERFLMTGLFAESFGWLVTATAVAIALYILRNNYNISFSETPEALKNVFRDAMDHGSAEVKKTIGATLGGDREANMQEMKKRVELTDQRINSFKE